MSFIVPLLTNVDDSALQGCVAPVDDREIPQAVPQQRGEGPVAASATKYQADRPPLQCALHQPQSTSLC